MSELKSVTFMLLSMCDFFAFVLKMEAPKLITFGGKLL